MLLVLAALLLLALGAIQFGRIVALPLLTRSAAVSESRQNALRRGGSIVPVLLDFERCYRAVASRDARFDGQFVTAVRTTGIYCRPSCPALTPKRTNVEFWPTAAAAQLRGFAPAGAACPTPCRARPSGTSARGPRGPRDAPDRRRRRRARRRARAGRAPPGTPSATSDGPADAPNWAPARSPWPGPIVPTPRGFSSRPRRWRWRTSPSPRGSPACGSSTTRCARSTECPTTLRAEASRRAVPGATGTIVLRLPYRPPFDAAGLLAFFAARAVAGVEQVDGGAYRRTMRLPRGPATVELALVPASQGGLTGSE